MGSENPFTSPSHRDSFPAEDCALCRQSPLGPLSTLMRFRPVSSHCRCYLTFSPAGLPGLLDLLEPGQVITKRTAVDESSRYIGSSAADRNEALPGSRAAQSTGAGSFFLVFFSMLHSVVACFHRLAPAAFRFMVLPDVARSCLPLIAVACFGCSARIAVAGSRLAAARSPRWKTMRRNTLASDLHSPSAGRLFLQLQAENPVLGCSFG